LSHSGTVPIAATMRNHPLVRVASEFGPEDPATRPITQKVKSTPAQSIKFHTSPQYTFPRPIFAMVRI